MVLELNKGPFPLNLVELLVQLQAFFNTCISSRFLTCIKWEIFPYFVLHTVTMRGGHM